MKTQLRNIAVVLERFPFHLWCGGSDLRAEWFVENHVYYAKDMDFGIRFRQHHEELRRLFLGCHHGEGFAVTLARRGELFMSASGWWYRYEATRLLYFRTPPVFPYCTGIYINSWDDNGRAEIIARMESELMTMSCFFAACWIGNSAHSFGHVQLNQHQGGILVPLSTCMLKYVEVLGL